MKTLGHKTAPSDLPYLIWAMSPTNMSDTGSWMTWLPRTTWNFCSCSMRLCSPRNCFSFDQSLKAVTNTTHTTDNRMAAPSIQPASASPSSSTPPPAMPHAIFTRTKTEEFVIYMPCNFSHHSLVFISSIGEYQFVSYPCTALCNTAVRSSLHL